MDQELMRKYCLIFNKLNTYNSKVVLSEDIVDRLMEYLSCVEEWNGTHNIVSNKISGRDLVENLFDSVIGGSFLSIKNTVYDVGSGGGFPSIPLAIIYPNSKFYLIESNRKKCSFLRYVKSKLKIENVAVENKRVENFSNINFITTKAAFSPANIGLLWKVLGQEGKLALWATKKNRESFVAALAEKGAKLRENWEYELLEGQERCVLVFSKS